MKMPAKLADELKLYFEKEKISKAKQDDIREKVKVLYKNVTYDPEEPIGVVTAQSLSEPATQMSIDHNEKVILKHNGRIRIAKIGEFVDKVLGTAPKADADGWEVIDISTEGIYVPSITSDEKIAWKPIKTCSRHMSPESLLKIKTLSGRKIVATDSHSFVTRRNNKVVSIAGNELKRGDRIPSLKDLPENCIQQLELKPILQEQRFAKKRLPETLNLTNELGWIFGAYLAEGNCTPNFVSFSNTDEAFLSRIRDFAAFFGFTFNEYDNERGFAPSHDIRVNSRQLSKLLKITCGTGSGQKKIPDFAYSASEDFVSGLLSGYFDGDGNVTVDRRMIRVSSNSKELMDGIALLLSRFGIFASKYADKQPSLLIPYKHSKVFREKIGFTVEEKAERLEKLCELYAGPEGGMKKYQDFIDVIGGFGNILIEISRKLGLPTRYVNSFTKRQKIGRETLLRHITIFEQTSNEKGTDIRKQLDVLKTMANSDVVWDEITDVSKVRPSGKYVYDFTVPGTETFTTFDGIVTHNTMRTYHFAGTAGIQVTLGLPRMLEIFDARKEPRTPTMMVYIKPGLSLDDVKKIAENIKELKVKDISISTVLDLTDMWIKCKLDMEKLKKLEIDPTKLAKTIKLKNVTAKVEGDTLTVTSKKSDVSDLRKLKYSVFETHVKGIKGITQVVVTKESGEWVINTLGSSLKKVFAVEGVDSTRTTSNNIFEVRDVLGVEAAREAIVRQAQYTMEEQGLGVDVRYIMLLADLMTISGEIRAIGRYGIAGQKASVMVRASFEETKKHFTEATIRGEKDPLLGTVENIMMNQVAPIGTGSFNLVGSIPGKGMAAKKAKKPAKVKESKTNKKAE
jgi:DNA-directed RNA polymerase subunit A"